MGKLGNRELLEEVMRKYFCYRQEGRRKYISHLFLSSKKVTFHTREREKCKLMKERADLKR